MVYKIKPTDPPLLCEENSKLERKRRYCLKNIKLIETKAAKDDNSINILFNRWGYGILLVAPILFVWLKHQA